MQENKTLNLKCFRYFIRYQAEGVCMSSLSGLVMVCASFNISLTDHISWQEAICKPDSLLCDKKSNFSLTERENT